MQKITNGIDACECVYFDDGFCDNDKMLSLTCSKNENCYYKKYERARVETLEYIKLYNAEVKKNEQLLKEIKFLQA